MPIQIRTVLLMFALLVTGIAFSCGVSCAASGNPSAGPPDASLGVTTDQTAVHTIPQDMKTINQLLFNHQKIEFVITDIPGGDRTLTTSSDPATIHDIQIHAWEMKARIAQGNNIRPVDPLFIELFRHHSEISVKIRNLPNGVEEDETSKNPQVTLLIRAHTRTVAGFVREGMPAARLQDALPAGYHASN